MLLLGRAYVLSCPYNIFVVLDKATDLVYARKDGVGRAVTSELPFSDDLPSEFGKRMDKVHDYVSENYHRRIYFKEMAALTTMSEQSFSRFFTKMIGRSFFSYLNEYRINMVVRMLLDTDYSVSQIGFSCGYDSLPFFHKQFLKFKGCTPLAYQRRFRL